MMMLMLPTQDLCGRKPACLGRSLFSIMKFSRSSRIWAIILLIQFNSMMPFQLLHWLLGSVMISLCVQLSGIISDTFHDYDYHLGYRITSQVFPSSCLNCSRWLLVKPLLAGHIVIENNSFRLIDWTAVLAWDGRVLVELVCTFRVRFLTSDLALDICCFLSHVFVEFTRLFSSLLRYINSQIFFIGPLFVNLVLISS